MDTEDHEFVILGGDDVQDFNPEGLLPLSDDELIKVQKWLAPTDYSAASSEWGKHRFSHLSGTGAWIFETDEYRQWHNTARGGLWIKAVAGAGKSVIAATIVSKLAAEEHVPVLYFFFRHIISANQKPKSLVRDFLSQLLQYSPKLQNDLFKIIEDERRSINDLSLDEFWNILVSTTKQLPRVYCVIDALDEMDAEHEAFLDNLVALAKELPCSIKVIFTSRPIPRIESHIRNTDVLQLMLQPHLVDPDISAYVRHRLRHTPMSIILRSQIHDTICGRAEGHFLYARLMIDDILDQFKYPTEQSIIAALDQLPTPMADMYTQMLLEHSQRSQTPQKLQVAILQWVTCAERPLRLLELSALIDIKSMMPGISRNAKAIVREACGPLIEIFEDETVHPIHHSFTEYLYDESRYDTTPSLQRFPVLDDNKAQRDLAVSCLKHVESIWSTEVGASSNTLAESVLDLKYPCLNYAAKYWNNHLRNSGATDNHILSALDKIFIQDESILRAWVDYNNKITGPRTIRNKATKRSNTWSPLHAAADRGLAFYVERLLQKGYEINKLAHFEHTPLSLAVREGHHEVVDVLLTHGADGDMPDKDGLKPLHYAARSNYYRVVKLLLEAGVDPITPKTREYSGRRCGNGPRTTGQTPVQYACSAGHLETVKVMIPYLSAENLQHALYWTLLKAQSEVTVEILRHPGANVNAYHQNQTPLYLASYACDVRIMRLLLDMGAAPNSLSSSRTENSRREYSDGRCASPLHAFVNGMKAKAISPSVALEGISLLIHSGIDPNITNAEGLNILHILVRQVHRSYPHINHESIRDRAFLTRLVELGVVADSITNDGSSALHLVHDTTLDVVDFLTEKGVSIDARSKTNGKTPLMTAIQRQDTALVGHLLHRGANVNIADHDGNTVLHLYALMSRSNSNIETITALIASGADVNARNHDGNTALHLNSCDPDMTDLFVKNGFDLESRDKSGQTILFCQYLQNGGAHSKQLLELGSDLWTVDDQGRTVVHAVFHNMCYKTNANSIDLIQPLIEQGMNPCSVDLRGNNLWHIAAGPAVYSYRQEADDAIMEFLLKWKVPPTARNIDGRTPLHVAFSTNQQVISGKVVEFLLRHDAAAINEGDYDLVRPLHLAARHDLRTTCFLLSRGADSTVTTSDGQTPLIIACRTRQPDTVCALLDYSEKAGLSHLIDQTDIFGRTALHHACRSGMPETVALLLDAGASVHVSDFQNATPLHCCSAFLDEDVMWRTPVTSINGMYNHSKTDKTRYVVEPASPPYQHPREFNPIRIRETIRLLVSYGADTSFLFSGICSSYSKLYLDDSKVACNLIIEDPLTLAIKNGCFPMVNELFRIRDKLLRNNIVRSTVEGAEDTPAGEKQDGEYAEIRGYLKHHRSTREEINLMKVQCMPDIIAKLFRPDENNFTLVKEALNEDDEPAVRYIAELGARFDMVNASSSDSVPSQLAAYGYADLLQEYKDCAAHITAKWVDDGKLENETRPTDDRKAILDTALHRSVPNMRVVQTIVSELHYDVNEKKISRGNSSTYVRSLLHELATPKYWWQTRALAYLIQVGAEVDYKDSLCRTPLIVALRGCDYNSFGPARVRVVEILLENGADPNMVDADGLSCLNIAAQQPQCVELLLKHGANASQGRRPFLFDAIVALNIDAIKNIISSGVDLNKRALPAENCEWKDGIPWYKQQHERSDMTGWSESSSLEVLSQHAYPIHVAASGLWTSPDQLDKAQMVFQLLFEGGADPQLIYEDGSSILHCLARSGGVLEPLLELPSCTTESRDSEGRTLLLAAAQSSCRRGAIGQWGQVKYKTIEVLLKHKASVTAIDNNGCNALHYLVGAFRKEQPNWDVFQAAVQPFLSSCTSRPDSTGRTPIHYAASSRHVKLISLLMDHGADPTVPDPIDYSTLLHHLAPNLIRDNPLWMSKRRDLVKKVQIMYPYLRNCAQVEFSRQLFASILTRGVPINGRDIRGETALFKIAATELHDWVDADESSPGMGLQLSTLQWMEAAGADLKARNNAGESVLHQLAKHAHISGGYIATSDYEKRDTDRKESFKWLVSKGLDVAWEDNEQRTCLDVAAVSDAKWLTEMYERKAI